MTEYLTVGQIVNTHGLKGEVKVYPLTDDIKRFRKLKNVYINGTLIDIIWCKIQTETVILKLDGIDNLESALNLKSSYLDIKRSDAIILPEDRHFITDLVGCKVFDEEGIFIGTLLDIIKTGSNDVYVVKDEVEILIPALKSIVKNIDIIKQEIVITPLLSWQ
ncbi:MAG TPA: ribosome maturation factor RimM [Clostridiaceae bacterium]